MVLMSGPEVTITEVLLWSWFQNSGMSHPPLTYEGHFSFPAAYFISHLCSFDCPVYQHSSVVLAQGQRLSAVLARPCLLADTGWQELKRRQPITLPRLGPGKDQARCDLDWGGIQLWMATGSARLLSLSNVITWCCISFNIALFSNGRSSPNGCCNLRTIYSYDSF